MLIPPCHVGTSLYMIIQGKEIFLYIPSFPLDPIKSYTADLGPQSSEANGGAWPCAQEYKRPPQLCGGTSAHFVPRNSKACRREAVQRDQLGGSLISPVRAQGRAGVTPGGGAALRAQGGTSSSRQHCSIAVPRRSLTPWCFHSNRLSGKSRRRVGL